MKASALQLGSPPPADLEVATPMLVRHDVQVWRIPLVGSESTRRRLAGLLSAPEQVRAARFRRETHRRRFEFAHGGLRSVLSAYLERSPEGLRFDAGPGGKPFLVRSPGDLELCFNLSHSADLALLAVTAGREVGVDVERLDPKTETGRLARRFFAPEERDALERGEARRRLDDFFRVWTLKEAYLKAVGTGLGRSLSSFAVSPHGEEPRLLRSEAGDVETWRLECLEVVPENGQNFAGALALERL